MMMSKKDLERPCGSCINSGGGNICRDQTTVLIHNMKDLGYYLKDKGDV